MVWAPGHRREIFALPAMRQGLRASIRHIGGVKR
jgi:hypothetical protein